MVRHYKASTGRPLCGARARFLMTTEFPAVTCKECRGKMKQGMERLLAEMERR